MKPKGDRTTATPGSVDDWEPAFDGIDVFSTFQNNKRMEYCYKVERAMHAMGCVGWARPVRLIGWLAGWLVAALAPASSPRAPRPRGALSRHADPLADWPHPSHAGWTSAP
eukprot:SAG22_NODE_699_length_7801_cov_6.003116_5_plen_111_part_00